MKANKPRRAGTVAHLLSGTLHEGRVSIETSTGFRTVFGLEVVNGRPMVRVGPDEWLQVHYGVTLYDNGL